MTRNPYDGPTEPEGRVLAPRDRVLDRALHLFEHDRDAYDRLPDDVKSRAAIYVDLGPGPAAA